MVTQANGVRLLCEEPLLDRYLASEGKDRAAFETVLHRVSDFLQTYQHIIAGCTMEMQSGKMQGIIHEQPRLVSADGDTALNTDILVADLVSEMRDSGWQKMNIFSLPYMEPYQRPRTQVQITHPFWNRDWSEAHLPDFLHTP